MIVSCGEALVDLVPDPVPGGGPMNVAIAAARLGAPSAFLGRVSTDHHGDLIWRHLADNGVDLSLCERGPEPTARAIVETTPRLRFRFEGTGTADTMLEHADLSTLGRGPHLVHGGTLGMFRGRTAEVLARLVERHDGLVSFDPNVRPLVIDNRQRWMHFHDRWSARAHLYRASDEDAAWIWPDRSEESWVAELLAGTASAVMVSRGRDGVVVYTGDTALQVPSVEVEVVDTVGAGDTFMGAILASLWELRFTEPAILARIDVSQWRVIAERAVHAAAITCSRRGADPPWRRELSPPGATG